MSIGRTKLLSAVSIAGTLLAMLIFGIGLQPVSTAQAMAVLHRDVRQSSTVTDTNTNGAPDITNHGAMYPQQDELYELNEMLTHAGMATDKLIKLNENALILRANLMMSGNSEAGAADTSASDASMMNSQAAMISAGPLIDSMGHMIEAIAKMHAVMQLAPLQPAGAQSSMSAATDDMTADLADIRSILDTVDQMLTVTERQIPMMQTTAMMTTSNGANVSSDMTGTVTNTTGTNTTGTNTTGTNTTGSNMADSNSTGPDMMGTAMLLPGMVDPTPMLPIMIQNVRTTVNQVRMMLDGLEGNSLHVEGTGATTAVSGTTSSSDTTGSGTGNMMMVSSSDLPLVIGLVGKSVETLGHVHALYATSVAAAGMGGMMGNTATSTETTNSAVGSPAGPAMGNPADTNELLGQVGMLAQTLNNHLSRIGGGMMSISNMGATGTTTDTTGMGSTETMTDTTSTGTADTGTTGESSATMMQDMGSMQAVSGVAQQLQAALQQIQSAVGQLSGTSASQ